MGSQIAMREIECVVEQNGEQARTTVSSSLPVPTRSLLERVSVLSARLFAPADRYSIQSSSMQYPSLARLLAVEKELEEEEARSGLARLAGSHPDPAVAI